MILDPIIIDGLLAGLLVMAVVAILFALSLATAFVLSRD
jgi:hypothetical protein